MVWALMLVAAMDSSRTSWPEEPTTFLGIALGEPLSAQMEECPLTPEKDRRWSTRRYAEWKILADKLDCFEALGTTGAKVHTKARPLGVTSIFASLSDGRVEGFKLWASHDAYPILTQVLIEKFGPPHRRWVEEYRNGMGNAFEGEVLEWRGRRLVMRYTEFEDTRDKSLIEVQTHESASAESDSLRARLEAEKKKF